MLKLKVMTSHDGRTLVTFRREEGGWPKQMSTTPHRFNTAIDVRTMMVLWMAVNEQKEKTK